MAREHANLYLYASQGGGGVRSKMLLKENVIFSDESNQKMPEIEMMHF